MKNWIDQKYPVGRDVELIDGDSGTIVNHTCHGMATNGIIVQVGIGNYVEVEASFLDANGNGPFVHDIGWS